MRARLELLDGSASRGHRRRNSFDGRLISQNCYFKKMSNLVNNLCTVAAQISLVRRCCSQGRSRRRSRSCKSSQRSAEQVTDSK